MEFAKIYQPAKTAMQSGRRKTCSWLVEHPPASSARQDKLMGWHSCSDTDSQVRLKFSTKDAAIAYCEAQGIQFEMATPSVRRRRTRSYADNFAFDRIESWTH